ncbi:MAG: VOC family protein [Candidatus Solibacter usitatus]|nr:VOC family protein [Candidatus Solibacter usitatus]
MRRLLTILAAPVFLLAQEAAHFHHVHLNVTDPAAAISFYTTKFSAEKSAFAGKDAVWAQKSWLLFDKVAAAPVAWPYDSPIWHIGWGAEDMPAVYKKQVESGTQFQTPLTDISDLANFKGFYYAYVDGPDHALIELNTAGHHNFGHMHTFSANTKAAAEWYAKYFAIKPRISPSQEPRIYRNVQVGPSASFTLDGVNVIIYPAKYRGHENFRSTRGTVFDHVAFSVEQLDPLLDRMKADGVKILEQPKLMAGTKQRSAMVEGPDRIAVKFGFLNA